MWKWSYSSTHTHTHTFLTSAPDGGEWSASHLKLFGNFPMNRKMIKKIAASELTVSANLILY